MAKFIIRHELLISLMLGIDSTHAQEFGDFSPVGPAGSEVYSLS